MGGCPRCLEKVALPATPQPLEKDVSGYRYRRPLLTPIRKTVGSRR
jgi:hypothetical protein